MSIYKDLEIIIADYVGYREQGVDIDEETGASFPNYECADPVQYDNIISDVRMHQKENMPFDYMSKDAQWCYSEWESVMESEKKYNEQFQKGNNGNNNICDSIWDIGDRNYKLLNRIFSPRLSY